MDELKRVMPGDSLYFIKVFSRGKTLYVHPDRGGYIVMDFKEGSALWKGKHEAILAAKMLRKYNPGSRFVIELLGGNK